MNCSIRKALPKDVQAACSVLRRSISECCIEDHHNDPEILSAWLRNKTPENLISWFSSPANFPVVATSGKDVVGVGLLSTKGEVLLCYVLPEVRFAGVGKVLLDALESHAREIGLPAIRLSSTTTAKPFYLRNGFTPCGPPEVAFGITAFPMIKQLGANPSLNRANSPAR